MKTYVALLRAVNVAGTQSIAMAALRDVPPALGYATVATVLQSGNLVFAGVAKPSADLERRLEDEVAARFGHRTDIIVRDAAAWDVVVAGNPFLAEARDDPARFVAVCSKSAPVKDAQARLNAAIVGRERAHVAAGVAYVVYPDGQGSSKLTLAKIEKALGTSATARNWNTVLKVQALLRG